MTHKKNLIFVLACVLALPMYTQALISSSGEIRNQMALTRLADTTVPYNPNGETSGTFDAYYYWTYINDLISLQVSPHLLLDQVNTSLSFQEIFVQWGQDDVDASLGKKIFYWDVALSRQYTFLNTDSKPYLDIPEESFYSFLFNSYIGSSLQLLLGSALSVTETERKGPITLEFVDTRLEDVNQINYWASLNFSQSDFTFAPFYYFKQNRADPSQFSQEIPFQISYFFSDFLLYNSTQFKKLSTEKDWDTNYLFGVQNTQFLSLPYLDSLTTALEYYYEDDKHNGFVYLSLSELLIESMSFTFSFPFQETDFRSFNYQLTFNVENTEHEFFFGKQDGLDHPNRLDYILSYKFTAYID